MRYICLIFFFTSLNGQSQALDSLEEFVNRYKADDTIKVNALNELSNLYQWQNFDSSLQYADQAILISEQLNYSKGLATARYLKGHCYWALGDNEIAIESGLEASVIAKREQLAYALCESYQVLARSYMDQTANEKATYYINLAEEIAIETKNWDQLSRVYNLAGVIQFVANDVDSARQLYEKALFISQKHNVSKLGLARLISNIGECYWRNNQDVAFQYFDQALAIARETKNRTAEAGISSIIGNALVRKGKYREAEKNLLSALKLSRELGLKRVTRHVYAGLSDLKAREGKTAEALAYMKNFYDVRDSILNAAKTRKIVELEAQRELEKKDQAIRLLEQERRIQKIWRNILVTAIVVFALIVAVVLYHRDYRERKNRKILNLEIDYLTARHNEISEKYKNSVIQVSENVVESQDQRLLKKAIEVVENNISDPLFGVEKMAKEMGMSRTNMHRKIKAVIGFPPSELIRSVRLKRAAALLLNQADSVSQIGQMVGFDDQSYFSKSFKKQYGVPPSEYVASVSQSEQLFSS